MNDILTENEKEINGKSYNKPAISAELTIISSDNPAILTKNYSKEGGEISVKAGGNLIKGRADLCQVNSLEALQRVILNLKTNQALTFGNPKEAKTQIITSSEWSARGEPDECIPRTRGQFSWSKGAGVMMIDYDPQKGGAALSAEELITTLKAAVPFLHNVRGFTLPSSSSHIFDNETEEDLTGLRGQRIYFLVDNASRIPELGKWIVDFLWASGKGYILISGSGAQLERTIVDASVWQPERLDFAAGAHCKSPLEQRRGKGFISGGDFDFLDTNSIEKPSKEITERANDQRLRLKKETAGSASKAKEVWLTDWVAENVGENATPEEKKKAIAVAKKARDGGELSGGFSITLVKDGKKFKATVDQILSSPDVYDGCVTLDPLEPEYEDWKEVGKLFLDNFPNLHSFAHGGRKYKLTRSRKDTPPTSTNDRIADLTADEKETSNTLHYLGENEIGDAKLFCELFADKYVFDPKEGKNGEFYFWNGSFWELDINKERYTDFDTVSNVFLKCAKNENLEPPVVKELRSRANQLRTNRRRYNVFETVSSKIPFKDEWDQAPKMLPCKNGVIDLVTGEFTEHRRERYLRKISAVSYNPEAKCPKFDQFLKDISLGKEDWISFLQRVIGYSVLGAPIEEIIIYLYGANGRNGKGTLMKLLDHVLGRLLHNFPAEVLLLQKFSKSSSAPSPEVANFKGIRVASFSEINKDRQIDSAKMKNYSGGDTITGRACFSNKDMQIPPTHTMFLQTNYKPKAPADDDALWARTILIPFNASFVRDPDPFKEYEKKLNEGLKEELLKEAEGVLNWIIEGCQAYQKNGLQIPLSIKEETASYRKENDCIGLFLEEECKEDPSYITRKGTMEAAIKDYCKEHGFDKPNRNELSAYLKAKFKEGRTGSRHWRGFQLRNYQDQENSCDGTMTEL